MEVMVVVGVFHNWLESFVAAKTVFAAAAALGIDLVEKRAD